MINSTSELERLKNCVALKGDLIIMDGEWKFNESVLEILSSVRFIYGRVYIKSNSLKSLSFLRNLEKVEFGCYDDLLSPEGIDANLFPDYYDDGFM